MVFIPVIHTKDEKGNAIDKICARDFWRGRDSYRKLQNDFHKYVTSKWFALERGLPVEETGAKHYKIEDLTNFENTKKVLSNIKLELPKVPDINDIKILQLNKARVEKDIIKPKDDLINELYKDNKALHRELAKQVKLVNEAEKCQKERDKILKYLNNKVDKIEAEYYKKTRNLDAEYAEIKDSLEKQFKDKENLILNTNISTELKH